MNLAANHPLDLAVLLETRMLVQAQSGGGKSWALRRLLEQTAPSVQQLIIDPEGEFATLREKYDYVIAAPHDADAVATPQTAALLARRLLETGVSAVLDIYDLKAHDRQLFVKRFLDALINAPRSLWHPVMVVIDESHIFCPQTGSAEAAGSVIDLATRGRKRGQCAVLATTRLSKLHKDAAAEMQNKLIGRTGLDLDVKRAADELGMTPRDAMTALRDLVPGQFYMFGPALSRGVEKITIGEVQTTHPKSGQRLMSAPPAPSKRVLSQLAKLADLQREAEQEAKTVEELQAAVTDLKRKLTLSEKRALQSGVPESEVAIRIRDAVAQARRDAPPAAMPQQSEKTLRQIVQHVMKIGELAGQALQVKTDNPAQPMRARRADAPQPGPVAAAASVNGLRAGAVRILQELAARAPAGYSRAQVGTLTGFSPKGGTFNTYLGDLRRGGYIEERDGLVHATDAGITALGDKLPVAPTSHDDAMALWRRALRKGAFEMLEAIVAAGSRGLSRDAVADAVGMVKSGGTFNTYLGDLRRNGLINERDGTNVASSILFPKGQA